LVSKIRKNYTTNWTLIRHKCIGIIGPFCDASLLLHDSLGGVLSESLAVEDA